MDSDKKSSSNLGALSQSSHRKIVPELDFCMATDSIKRWDEVSIFHNAGVTEPSQMFYKGIYQSAPPYNLDLKLNEKLCSYNYYKEIQSIEKQSTL